MHEVIVDGHTYPVGESNRPGKYARISFESINEGDQFKVLRPFTYWLTDGISTEIPVGTIFEVTGKEKNMSQDDQGRYVIHMKADMLEGEMANQSWTLLTLNRDIIVRELERI